MDAKDLLESLKADLICPICLGHFTDPVIAKCGHSFCSQCLLQCRDGADSTINCPECRQVIQISKLVPNRNLQNLSLRGKMIRPYLLQSMLGLTTCDQHLEKEKLFCEEDQRPLCESCSLATEHKDHQVLPLDKAADECREKLQETWNMLQSKVEEFKFSLDLARKKEAQYKENIHGLRETVKFEYEKMHQFLWDEEYLYMKIMDQECRDNLAEFEEKKARFSQQIQSLQQSMLKIEENLDKAPLEMLQDMKDTLARNEELLLQEPVVPFPTWSICPITGLRDMLKTFQRDITLDPETANPHLIVSEDLKTVTYTNFPQDLPDNEERFDTAPTVLGAQTFTSGRHYWEVVVGDKTQWTLGICEDSISRKGAHSLLSKDIRTLVGFKNGNDLFLWNSQSGFYESKPIHSVGIFLDYEKGHIAFYNVTERSLIFSPLNLAFQGALRPYFSPCSPDEENSSETLIICHRNNQ
ncbi:probable E3 ubiquitin-protein ligase TRIML1 [Dromiciops gliroides]|uniref:probable E3 ubiquitin-protein ligase TRIML1 n=1 Tax=Dromiciops gliroides TaxID=33562 RepID=UPI001CC556D9|nr:probable E3 ubiquitin-protein ligase TRIML1 [Dromiciops gliroides]